MKLADIQIDEEFIVISSGVVCMSVCVPRHFTMAEIEQKANEVNPTGLDHGWKKSDDETFKTGQANGCDCETYPETRRHWLLNC